MSVCFSLDCVWLGNDVGRRNYRVFLLFVTAVLSELIYLCGMCVALCVSRQEALVAPLCFMLFALVLGGPVGVLWLLHVRLTLQFRTTREYLKKMHKPFNPFGHATPCANAWHICCAPRWPSFLAHSSPPPSPHSNKYNISS